MVVVGKGANQLEREQIKAEIFGLALLCFKMAEYVVERLQLKARG